MASRKTEKQCSTCGGTCNAALIVFCGLCKDIAAHLYCVKNSPEAPPNRWYCEDCTKNKKSLKDLKGKSPLIGTEIGSDVKRSGVRFKEKKCIIPPQVGKVKYIPEEEIAFFNAQKYAKRSLDQMKSNKTRRVVDILRDGTKDEAVRAEIGKVEGKRPIYRRPNPYPQHEKLNNLPIATAIWKGGIEYFEHVIHSHNVEAHLAQNASEKVVEMSKKMAQIPKVNFKVKFIKEAWPKAFKLDPPTQQDIGFYFLSSETNRLKEKFIRLVERLNSSHQMLICQLGSLHLLIFSSQVLPKNIQCIRGEPYLWGVLVQYEREKKHAQVNVDSRSNSLILTKNQGKRVLQNSHASGSEPSRGRFRL